jgi:drug/metabolite transporter (DMT)-like permease
LIYLIGSIILTSYLTLSFKALERLRISSPQAIVINDITCVITGSIVNGHFPIGTGVLKEAWLPWAMLMGIAFIVLFNIIALCAQKLGVAITSVANKLSLVIPVLFSVYLYQERLNAIQVLGIVLALVAVVLTSWPAEAGARRKTALRRSMPGKSAPPVSASPTSTPQASASPTSTSQASASPTSTPQASASPTSAPPASTPPASAPSSKWLFALPLVLFLGSGLLDTLVKYVEQGFLNEGNKNDYLVTAFGVAALAGFIMLALQIVTGRQRLDRRAVLAGICIGVPNYFSIWCLVRVLSDYGDRSASIIPINNMGVVLFSALMAWLLFREHLTRANVTGILLAVAAIALIAYG